MSLESSATWLGAFAPCRPTGCNAINWAAETVAIFLLAKVGIASLTTVHTVDNNASEAVTSALVARLAAKGPFAP